MSSATDPIRQLRTRIIATGVVGGLVILACSLWSLLLVSGPPVTPPLPSLPGVIADPDVAESPDDDNRLTPLNGDAFMVKLWNPPPPPATPDPTPAETVAASERAAPVTLQLIAIVLEGPGHSSRRAVLYDPQADRLYIAGHGEQLQQYTISAVTQNYVEIAQGRFTHRLELVQAGGPY